MGDIAMTMTDMLVPMMADSAMTAVSHVIDFMTPAIRIAVIKTARREANPVLAIKITAGKRENRQKNR